MTRVEFIFNVPDKLAKTVELCERAVAKGRQLTVLSQDDAMSHALQQQLWQQSATSFLPSSLPNDNVRLFSPIVLDTNGEHLVQDDVLINLQSEYPPFFSRFRYLVELVGEDETDKAAARVRFKFYRDRGYEIKKTDMAKP
ncbi:MAG: DNA polymerase III subunit chi [Betaproteobacteria bacterium]